MLNEVVSYSHRYETSGKRTSYRASVTNKISDGRYEVIVESSFILPANDEQLSRRLQEPVSKRGFNFPAALYCT